MLKDTDCRDNQKHQQMMYDLKTSKSSAPNVRSENELNYSLA